MWVQIEIIEVQKEMAIVQLRKSIIMKLKLLMNMDLLSIHEWIPDGKIESNLNKLIIYKIKKKNRISTILIEKKK